VQEAMELPEDDGKYFCHADKKKINFFIYKEILKGAVAKSYIYD
jgi:hypothetical protein